MSAYDGDYANPRELRYEFSEDTSSLKASEKNIVAKISSYFKMNPETGVLSLRKDVQVMQIFWKPTLQFLPNTFIRQCLMQFSSYHAGNGTW